MRSRESHAAHKARSGLLRLKGRAIAAHKGVGLGPRAPGHSGQCHLPRALDGFASLAGQSWVEPGSDGRGGGDSIRPEIALVRDHLALDGMIGPVLIALAGETLMSLELMEK